MNDSNQHPHIYRKSKEYGRQLYELIKNTIGRQQVAEIQAVTRHVPERHERQNTIFLKFLFIYPYVLLVAFVLSFFWDFDNRVLGLFGAELALDGLLRILSISGLIGYLTNWLAITMLFRPVYRRPILGQGLVPAQKDRIAYRLAVAVSEDLINPEIIKQKINESKAITKYREIATLYMRNIIDDEEFRAGLKTLAYNYLNEILADSEVRSGIAKTIIEQIEKNLDEYSIEKIALKAYSFVKGREMQLLVEDALRKLPDNVEGGLDKIGTFLEILPDKINENSELIETAVTSLLHQLVNQLDVHSLVEDNLMKYDEREMEHLIKNASNDQLRYIQYLGAVLGTLGGFVIWRPWDSLLFLGSIIVIILAADLFLSKLKRTEKKEPTPD